ncbi:7-carboxy-7-deazaguanine synthase [uncultured archaeon]|nr:7-carboxy-7-deazaguanine synthase [uncultured archaeon]
MMKLNMLRRNVNIKMKIQTFNILAGNTSCNANCPFCISKMTPKNGINSDMPKINWVNFKKACLLAKVSLVNTVLITGKGEPLLYPEEITQFLEVLQKYNFPLIELQTNALVLGNDFESNIKRLKLWRELGLNTFVISIVHYRDERNREIYTPFGKYFDLVKLIENLHTIGFSVRLNCIMLKNYIDSIVEVKKMIKFCKRNKVEQLTLKPVEIIDNPENKSIAENTKNLLLPKKTEKDIQRNLEKNAVRLRTLDFGGVVYDFDGQNVCMTDCMAHKPFSEDLRQLIFFPDGHLRYDWRYAGAVLV